MKIEIDTVNKTLTIKGSFIFGELAEFINQHPEYSTWKIIPYSVMPKYNYTDSIWTIPMTF